MPGGGLLSRGATHQLPAMVRVGRRGRLVEGGAVEGHKGTAQVHGAAWHSMTHAHGISPAHHITIILYFYHAGMRVSCSPCSLRSCPSLCQGNACQGGCCTVSCRWAGLALTGKFMGTFELARLLVVALFNDTTKLTGAAHEGRHTDHSHVHTHSAWLTFNVT